MPLIRLLADQVHASRVVTFAPALGFPDFIDVTVTDLISGDTVSEASCSDSSADLHAILRRLVAQLEG